MSIKKTDPFNQKILVNARMNGQLLPVKIVAPAVNLLAEIKDKVAKVLGGRIGQDLNIPSLPPQGYCQKYSLDFSRSYFFKNTFKCLIALEVFRERLKNLMPFYDLGCGSGAFSFALAMRFPEVKIIGIDKSLDQLDIAESLRLGLSIGNVHFQVGNVSDFDSDDKVCFSSYGLSEAAIEHVDIYSLIARSKSFILIDHPRFIKGLEFYFNSISINVRTGMVNFSIDGDAEGLIEGSGGTFAYLIKN